MEQIFVREIVIVFFIAFLGGYIAMKSKLPPILGYLAGGVLLSLPFFADSNLINFEFTQGLAKIGVALLLFATGLEFPMSKLLSLKKSIVLATILQVILFILASMFLLSFTGFSTFEGVFISAAFSNSATIVILKLLEGGMKRDKGMYESILGMLILQDIAMIVLVVFIEAFAAGSGVDISAILESGAKASVFIITSVILGKTVIPQVFEAVSRLKSFEVLLLLAFVFCMAIAYFAEVIGFSFALGAFLAGVMVSESFVNHEVFSEVRPIRDLFSALFYVSLGSLISVPFLFGHVFKIVIAGLILIFVKIVVTFFSLLLTERQTRKAFMIGIAMMQGGEFAFILSQIGFEKNWIDKDMYSLVLLLTTFSLFLTPLFISRADDWYYSIREYIRQRFRRLYRILFVRFDTNEVVDQEGLFNHVVICGFGRVGTYVGRALEKADVPFVVVDSDSQVIDYCKQRDINVIFGDASNIDVLEKADVERAIAVVIALPEEGAAEIIASNVHKLNPQARVIARSHIPTEDQKLKTKGVSLTIEPEFEAAVSISKKILNFLGRGGIDVAKYLKKSRRRQRSKMNK